MSKRRKTGLDYGNIEWDSDGRARWRHVREVPCTGTPGYSGGCEGTWTDDYGSLQWCNQCHFGNGKMTEVRFIRLPQFDAKRPKKDWTPPSKDIEAAYE